MAAELNGASQSDPVIIDEIQKLPLLLDEVHWLMENKKLRFILCGSSARKLRRGHANLLEDLQEKIFMGAFPYIYIL